MKYEVLIFWSEEDDVYVAEIPELPGCKAHGANYGEALAQAESAGELWLATAQERGREIPKPLGRLPLNSTGV